MDITVSLQIKILFDGNKKLSVGNVATAVKELGLEQKVTEAVIEKADEELIEKYCGGKYARGNCKNRYQRAGSVERHPVTSVGKLNLKLHRVRDKEEIFLPVEDRIAFDGKKIYQEDISVISAELATKMTYRDVVKEGKQFIKDYPLACTINRRVIKYGEKINAFNGYEIKDASVEVAYADGTKTHSQEKGKSKNGVNVVLGVNNGKKVLLDARVNKPWKETASKLDEAAALDEKAVIAGDADREMRNALVKGERSFQLDLIHVLRDTSFKLWQDGEMTMEDRKGIIRRLESLLFALKNSVVKHRVDKDLDALKRRINCTVDELKKLAEELLKLGCFKAASFIRDYSNTIVTFAVLPVKGRKVPWNSNLIERLMGEISKRTKHKWMRWTTKGLETILNLILMRYVSEESYEVFKLKMMKSDNLNFIKGEVEIISVGGEF
jgi:transposase-like protein